jgi:hypothetical protein
LVKKVHPEALKFLEQLPLTWVKPVFARAEKLLQDQEKCPKM